MASIALTACGDKVIQLHYAPDAKIERLASGQGVTVYRFTDARGSEGDKGDVRRVGGIYGGYGNRLAKVMASAPWPETLVEGLAAGLTQRGMPHVVPVPDAPYASRTAPTTPLALTGEIRNFSTEERFTFQAHVSGIVRLYDQRGTLLVEKRISARAKLTDPDTTVAVTNPDPLEPLLNEALQKFIRAVVTDPEITQRLVAAR